MEVELWDWDLGCGRGFAFLEGLLAAFFVETRIGGFGGFCCADFGGVCMSKTRLSVAVESLFQDLG